MVMEKVQGEKNKSYLIKSWIMYKTQTKVGVSPDFEKVVKWSHTKHRLRDRL